MNKNFTTTTNNNIKSYVEVLVKQPKISQHNVSGVAFDRRKIEGRRTIVVMACGRQSGTQGMVEAKAITSMLMEWVLGNVPFLVIARWVARGFGCGVQYAVVDVDDLTGNVVLMDCSYESDVYANKQEHVELDSSAVEEDEIREVDRRFMAKICSAHRSQSIFTMPCGDVIDNIAEQAESINTGILLKIVKHNLAMGDSIILGSWIADNELDFQMKDCSEVLGDNIRVSTKQKDCSSPSTLNYLNDYVRSMVNNNSKINSELIIGVINRRTPRRLLFCSGPPFNEKNDERLCEMVDQWRGTKLISGGTTAQIVSRGLGREISVELKRDVSGLPPVSSMDGVDLITEGVLTLSKLHALLERTSTLDLHGEGIDYRVARMLLSHDEIQFLVGTRINVVHQDPSLPMEIELRRNVIKNIAKLLENKFLKRVKIVYL